MRLRELKYEEMDADQRAIHDKLISGPRGRIAGPYIAWLRTPALADAAERLGRYVRYETALPPRLSEFAILIAGRHWDAEVEWWAHHPLAIKGGLDPGIADAVLHKRRPAFVNRDEEIVYDLTTELLETKKLGAATYKAALDLLGEKALIDLVAIIGNYCAVALVLKTFEIEPPDGSHPFAS